MQLKNIHIFNGNDSVGCTFNIKWKGRVRWNNDLIWLGKQVSPGYGSESQSCKIGSIYLIKLEFDTGLRICLIYPYARIRNQIFKPHKSGSNLQVLCNNDFN